MQTGIPARIPFTVTPMTGMGTDPLGNDKPLYGTPVQRKAYAYAPHKVVDAAQGTPNRVTADVDLSAPSYGIKVRDKIALNGATYEVVGLRDNSGGFHGWNPGVVCELKVTSG